MKLRLLFPISAVTIAFIFFSFTDNSKKVRKNEAIAKSFIEAWSNHDTGKLLSLFAEECLYEEVASGRHYTDKSGIAGYMESTISGVPDSEFVIELIIADENAAMVEWIWKGTNTKGWETMDIPATDQYFELRGISVMTFKSNLITRNSDYWDWNTFMKGIGVE